MKYETCTLEELLLDDAFRAWATEPTAESEAFWSAFLADFPEKRPLVEEARRLARLLRAKETPLSDAEIRWELIRMRRVLDQPDSTVFVEQNPSRFRRWVAAPAFRLAAALALVAGVLGWWYVARPTTHYETAFGESRRVELPDGSVVTLNANSDLRTTEWKPGQPREVWLDGEAFFEITHQPDHARRGYARFVVHTPDVAVEVLGTTFNVSRRRSHTRVVLNSGRVQLKLDKRPDTIPMRPGDLVDVSDGARNVERRVVKPADFSAWRQNRLVFNNTPIGEIAHVLEDTYGLTVRFDDPTIAQRRVSGTVPSSNRQRLIAALAALLDDRIEERDGVLIFRK